MLKCSTIYKCSRSQHTNARTHVGAACSRKRSLSGLLKTCPKQSPYYPRFKTVGYYQVRAALRITKIEQLFLSCTLDVRLTDAAVVTNSRESKVATRRTAIERKKDAAAYVSQRRIHLKLRPCLLALLPKSRTREYDQVLQSCFASTVFFAGRSEEETRYT